jgi:hypothetical protein
VFLAVCLFLTSSLTRAQDQDIYVTEDPEKTAAREQELARHREELKAFEDARTSWTGDRVALLAQAGLAAPAGDLGASLDLAPIPNLALNVGAGLGQSGPQCAAMLRGRFRVGVRGFLGAGLGYSFGPFTSVYDFAAFEETAPAHWSRAYWRNVAVSFDLYAKHGRGIARFEGGFALLLNPHDYTCSAAQPSCSLTDDVVFFGSAAYGFDL